MRPKISFLIVILMAAVLAGCSKPKEAPAPKANKKPLIDYVQSPELAKVILKPQQKRLAIAKDPFKPILTKNTTINTEPKSGPAEVPTGKSTAEDVILIGVIKMGDDFRVYLQTANKSGVYKVNDKVDEYTIIKIGLDQVVLKIGEVEIVKKRGNS